MTQNKHLTQNFILLSILSLLLISCGVSKPKTIINNDPWESMQSIINNVKEPVFANKEYLVSNYGANPDGIFDNTEVFKKAIQDCSKNGGGIVIVSSGKYYIGPIHLEDNVNLHIEEGAELLFSTKPTDYPIVHTSFEGTELMNYSPLIYAYKKHNVAVTGKGILNGQATNDNWWPWCGSASYGWKKGAPSQSDPLNRPRLVDMAEENIPVNQRVFGEGRYIRPNFIEFFECTDALLKDVTIINAPFWVIHPIKSTNVTIDGVTVRSHGPNNDGCDPEYSKNVIIKNCTFDTGDDCIAIKAGRDADGRRVGIKSENIIVQKCTMFDGHGGVTIGSEISAGVSNVYVEDCIMNSTNLDVAIRLKTNSRRGALIENFFVRNIEIGQVREAVLKVDMFYNVHGNQTGNFIPRIENIYLENVTVKNGGNYGILAKGYAKSPIKNITFKKVTIDTVGKPFSIENVANLNFIDTKINDEIMRNAK